MSLLLTILTLVSVGNVVLVNADDAARAIVTKKAFLDMTIGGQPAGRIVMGLFGDINPKTVANFVALADGEVRDFFKVDLLRGLILMDLCAAEEYGYVTTCGQSTALLRIARQQQKTGFIVNDFNIQHTVVFNSYHTYRFS